MFLGSFQPARSEAAVASSAAASTIDEMPAPASDALLKKKNKKKIRPKLQPKPSSKRSSDGSPPRENELGFEDIQTNSSALNESEAQLPYYDTNATIASDENVKQKQAKKKIREAKKLEPISTKSDVDDDLYTPSFATPSPKSNTDDGSGGKLKLQPSTHTKLQPRSSPLFSKSGESDLPHTPDDDDYNAFGFDLINQQQQQSQQLLAKETSPLALRRVMSSGSYISDDSSSEDEFGQSLIKEDGQSEHLKTTLSSSDEDDSYFITHRAIPQQQPSLQQRPHPMTMMSNSYPNTTSYQNNSQGQGVMMTTQPPQLAPTLLMRLKSFPPLPGTTSTENARQNEIELKLSLSEEESASNNGNNRSSPSSSRQMGTPCSFNGGSVSSVDDQVIANELNAYSLSTKLNMRRRSSMESADSTTPGRHAPFGNHHVDSVIQQQHSTQSSVVNVVEQHAPTPIRNFYNSPQSAMPSSTEKYTITKPRPNHDSSFLNNLRDDWVGPTNGSVASVDGSFIISSRGAFGEPEMLEEVRSPTDDHQNGKSSSTHTPQSNLMSLAYSDEEGEERRLLARRNSRSCLDKIADNEGAINTTKPLPNVKVYSSRWFMLLCLFLLNSLSDLTCFSIAPIAIITSRVLDVDAEMPVILFLSANVLGTFLEPVILKCLGLRRTILLGSLLLMIGNVVKSGNGASVEVVKHFDERDILFAGFLIAGLSRPLYERTSMLAVNAWFPEWEKKFATDVISNSKPIGIGSAFVMGSFFVKSGDDMVSYFHLLSGISIVLFVGLAMQLEDAPPTPPCETMARVVRGTIERPISLDQNNNEAIFPGRLKSGMAHPPRIRIKRVARPPTNAQRKYWAGRAVNNAGQRMPLLPSTSFSSAEQDTPTSEYGAIAQAPPAALDRPTELVMEEIDAEFGALAHAPSPMMPGSVANRVASRGSSMDNTLATLQSYDSTEASLAGQQFAPGPGSVKSDDFSPNVSPFPNLKGGLPTPSGMPVVPGLVGQLVQPKDYLPSTEDDGAEPIMIQSPRLLDIDIRGDQTWRSLRACFACKGLSHCVFAYATSGAVTNTLSTFMAYLVTLNGDGLESYIGKVGAAFQLSILVSSLMCGRWSSGQSPKSFMVILTLLALGALVLALCDANLDESERLWTNLLMVAVLTGGSLRHFSTELG